MPTPRTILITGASGALGSAVVEAFGQQGDHVVTASHPEYDLSQPADAARAAAAAGQPLGALIHLVGTFAGGQSVAETSDATWRMLMSVNLDAAFYTARAALPALLAAPGARIIMIGARNALLPVANLSAYNVSKAGVVALVQTLAHEIGPRGATANAVLPSTIDTAANRHAMPKADFSRWVAPSAIANLIVWLASPQAQDVNGAAIPIYGRG